MDAQTIVAIVIVAAVLLLVLFLAFRKPAPPEVKAPPREREAKPEKPKTSALDDRMEVEAPVEIHEGMSLAEIKRAKAAKIKGEKGRRETAVEATKAAKESIAEEPEEPEEPEEAVRAEEAEKAAEPEVPEETAEATAEPAEKEEEKASGALAASVSDDISAGWDALDADLGDDLGLSLPSSAPAEPKAPEPGAEAEPAVEPEPEEEQEEAPPEKVEEPVGLDQMSESLGTPLHEGLARTRSGFIDRLGKLFRKEQLDEEIVEEVEEVLYTADIGSRAASDIMKALENRLSGDDKRDPKAVWNFVRTYVEELLEKREQPLDIDRAKPFVILVIGVNGVGKTTTIGKMAAKFKRAGKKVLLVAGDTFRAAAVEQIEVWGERAEIPVHAGEEKADPASVVFSGVERARDEGFDVVICDTAGRLHTKAPLLDELTKVSRVTKKVMEDAPHETILVLDANTGQNAIQQAKMFSEAVDITGIVLTKLDGTAKGGVILGICDELDAPIRYIGIGESVADLRTFSAHEFVEALFM